MPRDFIEFKIGSNSISKEILRSDRVVRLLDVVRKRKKTWKN